MLGGGGSASAYEVGYLHGLIKYDNQTEVDNGKYTYDTVTGVSGGSINALTIAAWPKGKERDMIEYVSDKWRTLKTSQVFTLWDAKDPIIDGIFNESGIFNDAPLRDLMNGVIKEIGDMFEHKFQRMIRVDATDANTATFVSFTEKNMPFDNFTEAIVSSASLPGIFPS